MFRTLEVAMKTADQEHVTAAGQQLLINLTILSWIPYRLDEGGIDHVMDSGGNDDVAFRISLIWSEADNAPMVALYLGKWVMRPSHFVGRLHVEEIRDEEEEDRIWLRYERKLTEMLQGVAQAIQGKCNAPFKDADGTIVIRAAFHPSSSDSVELDAHRAIAAAKWTERLKRSA
jgi:hypothetical protein